MDEITKTAYHESGHAVAAYCVNRKFRYASIKQGEDCFGQVLYEKYRDSFKPDRLETYRIRPQIEKTIITSLAGNAAERILCGDETNDSLSMHDFANAVDFAGYLTVSNEEAEADVNWLFIRSKNILKLDFNWNAVKELAEQLIKRKKIGYRTARKIIFDAQQEAAFPG